jgi:hypothetical protein
MRKTLRVLCPVILLVAFGAAYAYEDDNDIGPAYKQPGQQVVCSVHCDEGPCHFKIRFYDQNGNNVKQQEFWDVPENGSRSLAYNGFETLVHCGVRRLESPARVGGPTKVAGNVTDEPSLAHLDPAGKVVATMTNERGECHCLCNLD